MQVDTWLTKKKHTKDNKKSTMLSTWLTKKNNQIRKTMAERNAHQKQKQKNKPATTSMSIQQLCKSKNQKHTGIARHRPKKNFFTDQEGKNRSNPKKNSPPPSE